MLAVLGLGILIWASDRITLQGERTIYSVICEGGDPVSLRCTSRLAVGERYRFRASVCRNEVVYWIAGSRARSGKSPSLQPRQLEMHRPSRSAVLCGNPTRAWQTSIAREKNLPFRDM